MRPIVLLIVALLGVPGAQAGFVDPHQDEAYTSRTLDIHDASSTIVVRRHFTINQTEQAYVWFDSWTSESVAKGFQVAYRFGPADSSGAPASVLLSNANVHNTDTSTPATLYAFTTYVLEYTVTLPPEHQRSASTSSFVGIVALREGQGTGGSGGVLDPSIGTRLDVTFTGADPPPPTPTPPPPPQNETQTPPPPAPPQDCRAAGDAGCPPPPPVPAGYESPCIQLNATVEQDRDGLPDTWEEDNFHTLAETASGDFDGDGFSNCAEYLAASDPTNPRYTPADKDGNGLVDTCEQRYWNRLGVNGNADDDGDGYLNRVECLLGSNPRDASSLPAGVPVRKDPPPPAPVNTTAPAPEIHITNQFQVPPWLIALLVVIAVLSLIGLFAGRRRKRDDEPRPMPREPPPDAGPFLLRSDPFWDQGPLRRL